jgi:Cd2+/Zn2+-exporting ATPase
MTDPGFKVVPADPACVDTVNEAVAPMSGIVGVRLDSEHEAVSIHYDPAKVSEPDIVRLAQSAAPAFQRQFQKCSLQLERQGGRACEACALSLENRVRALPGVRRATASYRGGVLTVTYDQGLISPAQITEQVAGLGASPSLAEPADANAPAPSTWARVSAYWTEDKLEAACTVITLAGMLGGLIAGRSGAPQASLIFYAMAYAAGSIFGIKGGLESLRHFTVDIDLLMVLAAAGAWLVGSPFEGAMLLFLFSLSNVLQAFALDRTRNAIRALMKLRPNTALVKRGSRTVLVPVEQVSVGEHFVLRPGDRIALDGVVVDGESAVDQSSLTGESIPVGKRPGNPVLAGTINQNGSLEVEVTKLAKDSTIAKMIKLVEEAHSEKAKTQRFIDKFEQHYAVAVIVFTAVMIVVPFFILREAFQPAFYRAMTIMVAASPCALVISTPASILSGIGNGARRGVLFKGGVHLEQAAGIKVVAFDKTGTLTWGKPQVTEIFVLDGFSEADLLRWVAAVENKSGHPLAKAVVTSARERGLTLPEVGGFQSLTGQGVRGVVEGQVIAVGNLRYFENWKTAGLAAAEQRLQQMQDQGQTSIVAARLNDIEGTAQILGVIGLADVLRPDAIQAVKDLKALGVERVVMLTGDHNRVAKAIAAQAGVDEYYADLMPEDKLGLIKDLKAQFGVIAMVGDGVNDAPALAAASIGIAMGAAGSDVALETADVVLMADNLKNLPYVIDLSRKTRQTLMFNLGFAMFMIVLMIISIFSIKLPLPFAVVGHEGGTVLVALNGLRLLAYKGRV